LKYLSFPSQVLSKSCKIIPVMLVGVVVNKKYYPLQDYIEALVITAGVALFTFAEKAGSHLNDMKSDSLYGIVLIAFYLACDSFTSQWQSKVYKQYGVDQYQMMFGVNFWSLLFTG
jgi:adenosine 3'-phospho 5'-phosphosulfate transporter B2